MENRPKHRTNFFSNPAVQGRIIFVFFALTALLIATNWFVALRALDSFGQAAIALPGAQGAGNDIQLLLEQQRTVLVSQLSVYTLLSVFLVILGAVLISHHIGGPLHHLASYCRGVARGEKKPREIHFRKHDIPTEVASAFNEFQRHHGIIPKADDSSQSAKD